MIRNSFPRKCCAEGLSGGPSYFSARFLRFFTFKNLTLYYFVC